MKERPDKGMLPSMSCPCGTEKALESCCLPYIQGKRQPATAEELLRSRYTAFTRGDVDYILSTHHSKTRGDVKREEVEEWSKQSDWHGLHIVESNAGKDSDQEGWVAFLAEYSAQGKRQQHTEQAFFQREDGQWRFLDARALKGQTYQREEPKIGRNDPCSCGSGKKYKKCCG
jgi:SEC-C motif-containing protein